MAPKTKIYDTYPRRPYARADITDLLKTGRTRPQVDAYVRATTKAEALEFFAGAGVLVDKPREIRVGMGDYLKTLEAAGLLAEPGDVVVTACQPRTVVVCRMEPGHDPEVAGEFGYGKDGVLFTAVDGKVTRKPTLGELRELLSLDESQ